MTIENIENHMAYTCKCGGVNFALLKSGSIECNKCSTPIDDVKWWAGGMGAQLARAIKAEAERDALKAALPAGELTTGIAHSLAGFRGAFESEYKRKPTEQEIWNHAIRSWRDLVQPQAQYSLDADQQGIRARVISAVIGAMAYGANNTNKPPEGHWLNAIWDLARAERELAAARSQPTTEESLVVAGAQPVREPLSESDIKEMLSAKHFDPSYKMKASDIVCTSWYKRGVQDAEAAHGITKKGAPGAAKEQTP